MKLYEIEAAIMDCIDEETGEVVDVEKLEALEMERDAKISNIACWIKDLRAEAAAIKAEKDNLEGRMKAKNNLADKLSLFLQNFLNGAKFEDSRCAISYRKSEATEIAEGLDLNTLPDYCKTIKISANKTAIKDALKQGEKIEGCSLVVRSNIQIK